MNNELLEKAMAANAKLVYQNGRLHEALLRMVMFIDCPEEGAGSEAWKRIMESAREALKLKN